MITSNGRVVTKSWNRLILRSIYCHGGASPVKEPLLLLTAARVTPGRNSAAPLVGGMGWPQQLRQPLAIRFLSGKVAQENETKETLEDAAAGEQAAAHDPESEASSSSVAEQQLINEVKELRDQLLRSLAEQENTRRIAKRDVEEARSFAIKTFAKSLLEVSDNLSRALEAVPEDHRANNEGHPVLATLYKGIQMTDQELAKAFERNGLVKYGRPGEVFDPNLHEALYEYVDPNKKPGTIGQVMKPGFTLNKRVLRPAEVGVIKKA